MQRIHRPKHLRMLHPKPYRPIPTHKVPRNPPRIPRSQRPEVRIHVGHQFLHHKIFPVPRHRRVHIPRAPQRRSHIHRHKDEPANRMRRHHTIKQRLRPILIEQIPIAHKGIRQKVNHRIPLRPITPRPVITRRQIHHQLSHRTRPNLVLRKVLRLYLSINHPALQRLTEQGKRRQSPDKNHRNLNRLTYQSLAHHAPASVVALAFLVCHPRRGPAVAFAVPLHLPFLLVIPEGAAFAVAVVVVVAVASALASRYPKASALGLSTTLQKKGLQPLGYAFSSPPPKTTKYQTGQTKNQFTHHPPQSPIPIDAPNANIKPTPAPTVRPRNPHQTPSTAGKTNNNKQPRDNEAIRNRARQNKQGENVATTLTHKVRRETDPTTNPLAQASTTRSTARPASPNHPPCNVTCRYPRLTETENPISRKLNGSATPNAATHGLQLLQSSACLRTTNPSTSSNPRHAPSPASTRSPSTASRSSHPSSPAAPSTTRQSRRTITPSPSYPQPTKLLGSPASLRHKTPSPPRCPSPSREPSASPAHPAAESHRSSTSSPAP